MASQDMKISKFSGGMPPDPTRLSCYAADFALATNLFTIYLLLRLTVAEHPYNQA